MPRAPLKVESLAREHTESAIKTLVQIMRQPKAQPAARVTAAQALLDRGWGKPEQPNKNTHDVSDDLATLLREIASDGKRVTDR